MTTRMTVCFAGIVFIVLILAAGAADQAADDKQPQTKFPSGKECAARMTVPEGFEVKCFAAEPDVINPIGIDFDHKGRVYVLECLEYPHKAKPGAKTRDRITILEDTDGDGVADKVTRFAEGLNLATGLAVGHGGVFVGQAPELLFLEDTDGDGKADKRTVLLDGWGHQDTHETLNSFIWGPDGWLYGCHGVFTHSKVGKPGTPDKDRVPLNAGIWRYHPLTKTFEVFAEGTSNPWGFDFDENGSGFLTACVIPHLFHMVPGGLYIRQAGQNFNPYAYGQIREICDHVHYFGPSPHGGNKDPRSLDKGGGHAHAGCLIYQGGAYPKEWNGRVFMNNIHGGRINTDILKRNGSTYTGSHGSDFLVANDPNFRAIQLRTGPDGSVYLIDWYDPQICHNTNAAIWDRSDGRIYKVVYKGTKQPKVGDLTKRTSEELVELLKDKNSWWWRKALLILQERGDKAIAPKLQEMVTKSDDYRHALRALWALSNLGALDEKILKESFTHPNAWVRAWAVRLAGQGDAEPRMGSGPLYRELLKLAEKDPSPDVRMQIASSCQRLRPRIGHDTMRLLEALMLRSEDAKDPVIPLMIWVAYEPDVADHYDLTLKWLAKHAKDYPIVRDEIAPRAVRRVFEAKHLEASLAFLTLLEDPRALTASLDGLLEALKGRRLEPGKEWVDIYFHLRKNRDETVVRRVLRLGIHFGEADAVAAIEKEATDHRLDVRQRIEAVQALGLARVPTSVEPLVRLAVGDSPSDLKRETLRALAGFDSGQVPKTLLADWPKLPVELRTEVVGLLSGRKAWAGALLDAMAKGTPAKQDLTENDVRRILALKDAELNKKVETVWGKLRERTPEKIEQQLAKFHKQLTDLPGDHKAGQAVFEKNCMVCHKLHGKGHDVGPDLTGANRRDPEYLLVNILDPNRVVGKDYYTATVADKSGRIHTGLVVENTPQRVTLKGENAKLTTLPRDQIEEMRIEEKSLMPEGLPEAMTEQQFRDLIAFLMPDPYLNRGLIAGPFKMAIDSKGPIEEAADPLKAEGVKWKPFQLGPAAVLDMEKLGVLAPPTDSTAYVYVEVTAPQAYKTELEVSADEDVKVWLNGKEVHRRTRSMEPRRIPIELKEGTNRLLFKVHNIYGPSWLRARLIDPEHRLEVKQPAAP